MESVLISPTLFHRAQATHTEVYLRNKVAGFKASLLNANMMYSTIYVAATSVFSVVSNPF